LATENFGAEIFYPVTHGVETAYRPLARERRKLRRIVRAIRKAKAETLFGIGVKLSVTEYPDDPDNDTAIDDARRSIGRPLGFFGQPKAVLGVLSALVRISRHLRIAFAGSNRPED